MTDTPKGLNDILNKSAPEPKAEAPAVKEPAPEKVEKSADTAPVVDKRDQDRNQKGQFASKQMADPVAPEPKGEKPTAGAPPAPVKQDDQSIPPGHVPVAALVDVRMEARLAKQEAERLQKQLAELQNPKKEQEPVDFFTDPDAAIRQSLTPVEQRLEQMERQWTLRTSRAEATASYGKDAVAAAEKAIQEAMDADDPEVYRLREVMVQSPHPVEEAIKWHQRRSVLSEVGDDPVAYRERLKAELLAELQAEQPAQPAARPQHPAVMPSNLAGARNTGARTGPAWSGPAPINDIFNRNRTG